MHCSFINHKQHLMYTGHIVTDWLVMLQATKRSSTQWGQFIAFIYKNLTCHCHHNWILHKCSWWGNIHRWTVSLALSIHLAPHVMAGLTEWCDVNSCDITCHGRPHRVMRREFMWHHVMPGLAELCNVNSCDITCHGRPHIMMRREFMWHHMSCQASPSCAMWIHVTSHVMTGLTAWCDVRIYVPPHSP